MARELGAQRRAVVTGASSGIGLMCCRELLQLGWNVVGLDVAESPLWDETFDGADRFTAVACDVSSSGEIESAFRTLGEQDGLDALICCAGILRGGPLLQMSEKDYDAVFDINAKGAWLATRAAQPLLAQARAGNPRIVFVSSGAALRPKIGAGAYGASKSALIHLARVLAVELAAQNILVNVVAPATVDTPLVHRLMKNTENYKVTGVSPLGRIAQPSDVTAVIRFLLGPDSTYMTGAVLPVDGGTTAAFVP